MSDADETTVGKPNYDFLGQVTYNTSDGADWSKGAIMFDFPSFRPTIGDHKRFNEQFCKWLGAERRRAEQADVLTLTSQITTLPTRSSMSSRAARTGPKTPARCLPGRSRTWIQA